MYFDVREMRILFFFYWERIIKKKSSVFKKMYSLLIIKLENLFFFNIGVEFFLLFYM